MCLKIRESDAKDHAPKMASAKNCDDRRLGISLDGRAEAMMVWNRKRKELDKGPTFGVTLF